MKIRKAISNIGALVGFAYMSVAPTNYQMPGNNQYLPNTGRITLFRNHEGNITFAPQYGAKTQFSEYGFLEMLQRRHDRDSDKKPADYSSSKKR